MYVPLGNGVMMANQSRDIFLVISNFLFYIFLVISKFSLLFSVSIYLLCFFSGDVCLLYSQSNLVSFIFSKDAVSFLI
jgi:hypothetical protein